MNKNDFFTIFIFPFKYEAKGNKDIEPDKIAKKLSNGNTKPENGWAVKTFNLDKPEHYNEYYYFHPFVREAIFNKKANSGMEYLQRTDFEFLEVEYYYDDIEKNCIKTEVKSIDLHLFDNQIGLLTLTTEKRERDTLTSFSDFLRYNDISRRVYPPHLGNRENTDLPKCGTKLLPSKVSLLRKTNNPIIEEFDHIPFGSHQYKDILYLSKIIQGLLPPLFILKEYQSMDNSRMEEGKVYFTPFTDDRMFVVSYYADEELSGKLKKRCCDCYAYENSNDWYKYLFVDGKDIGIQNNVMKKELIKEHSYSRWVDYGTLYGMSRYSLVMLCSTDAPAYLKQHMKSMYYQMALIVLFQRAMLLKFSDDIFRITKDIENTHLDKLQEETSKLHGDFIKFINNYWFIEVTPQEQGIEMYNQWMDLLNIDKLYQEVEKEIVELARYVEGKIEFGRNKIEAERNRRLEMLTIWGVPLAVSGLIIGFWQIYAEGIDELKLLPTFFKASKDLFQKSEIRDSFIILILILAVAFVLVHVWVKKKLHRSYKSIANGRSI